MVKMAVQPVVDVFVGSDKTEICDSLLEVYAQFLEYHGKEVHVAFVMRGLQYLLAYRFLTTNQLSEYGSKGQGLLNQSCKRVAERILATGSEKK